MDRIIFFPVALGLGVARSSFEHGCLRTLRPTREEAPSEEKQNWEYTDVPAKARPFVVATSGLIP
jgi:hypothetical protein